MTNISELETLLKERLTVVGDLNTEQQQFVDTYLNKSEKLPVLRHPLLIEVMFIPILGSVRWAMAIVKMREEKLNKTLADGKYAAYIFQHERPFRLGAFLEVQRYITDSSGYWELVDDLWSDSEDPCFYESNRIIWCEIWGNEYGHQKKYPPCREDDTEYFNALADTITVYRGGHENGLSWTLNKKKAEWFSHRYGQFGKDSAPLWAMEIKKSDITWYTDSRNEQEVILTKITGKPVLINGEEK